MLVSHHNTKQHHNPEDLHYNQVKSHIFNHGSIYQRNPLTYHAQRENMESKSSLMLEIELFVNALTEKS
jgi:hypothetical protein